MKALKFFTVAAVVFIVIAAYATYLSFNDGSLRDGVATADPVFWAKVGFSALFSIAALYVIVIKPTTDPETKQWAFSILSLVAGVWIGTLT